MKKWPLHWPAFLLCFALGVAAHFVWHRNDPVSLCEISAHPERYAGKLVRIRALVSRDVTIGAPLRLDPMVAAFTACKATDEWPATILDFDEQQSALIRSNIHVWRDRENNEVSYVSDAVVVGTFDPHDDGITRCFTPRYELRNAKLEHVISTTTVSPEQTVAWVKSKSQ